MIDIRVTQLEHYRAWLDREDWNLETFLQSLYDRTETPQMARGTAFHKAMELLPDGAECETISALGHTFHFGCDLDLALPKFRERELVGIYGDLRVTGHVDGIAGNLIQDHKSTAQFDAERYLASYQWRYYLDLAKAQMFQYNVFVMDKMEAGQTEHVIREFHLLRTYAYPDLHTDCRRLAAQFTAFHHNLSQKEESCYGLTA